MKTIKTEILGICEAFNLGDLLSMKTLDSDCEGFVLTEFKTSQGKYTHYFKQTVSEEDCSNL